MPTITANLLKAGDILVTENGLYRVDAAVTNPRRKYNNAPGDMLVDVDATGISFVVPCKMFTSYTPTTLLTIEAKP